MQPHKQCRTISSFHRPPLQESKRPVYETLRVAAQSIDDVERQPSLLALLEWSKADAVAADAVAAELEELAMSQAWVDVLAAEKDGLIQHVGEFIMRLTHLHHADFDMRLRQKLAKRCPPATRGDPPAFASYQMPSAAQRRAFNTR